MSVNSSNRETKVPVIAIPDGFCADCADAVRTGDMEVLVECDVGKYFRLVGCYCPHNKVSAIGAELRASAVEAWEVKANTTEEMLVEAMVELAETNGGLSDEPIEKMLH